MKPTVGERSGLQVLKGMHQYYIGTLEFQISNNKYKVERWVTVERNSEEFYECYSDAFTALTCMSFTPVLITEISKLRM